METSMPSLNCKVSPPWEFTLGLGRKSTTFHSSVSDPRKWLRIGAETHASASLEPDGWCMWPLWNVIHIDPSGRN
jgi:hypothetical protein